MPSFPQLCQDVITKTGRPELIAETQLAVRDATKFLHLQEFFLRDSEETLLQYPNPDYVFQIDTSQLTRFRKIRYIKKYDTTLNLAKESDTDKLSEVDPDFLFDRYNNRKTNVFYLAGTSINVRSHTQESGLLVSWYKYPNTSPEGYSSWIADMYDTAIVNRAAAQIMRMTGMTEAANALDKWVITVDIPTVRMNDIEAAAR